MISSPWFLAMFSCLANFFKKEGTFPQTTSVINYVLVPPYDFIIVGSGSAGSVLANRLSEENDWKILLLESGGLENEVSITPMLALNLWRTSMDWNYTTTKQKICKDNNWRCNYMRGHVLGGTSSVNYINYVRGNKLDYDNWRNLGNPGWGYDDILPYFLKSEDIQIDELKTSKYHSTGGPISISRTDFKTPLREMFIEAAQEMGYKQRDFNGELQTGINYVQSTMQNGYRCGGAQSFLKPLYKRRNVHIVTGVRVTEVVIESGETSKRAVGVKFMQHGKTIFMRATKEVILSAGTINTPQILMLSGIGNKSHLEKLKIPVKQNLPVGDNFQDHCLLSMGFSINESVSIVKKDVENSDTVLELTQGKGILTSPFGLEAVGYFSHDDDPDAPMPDTQVMFHSKLNFNVSAHGFSLSAFKVRPLSRGTLRLKSKNPFDAPLINPNYLAEEGDFNDTVKNCKLLLKIASTKALAGLSPVVYEPKHVCPDPNEDEDEFCKCLIENYTSGMFHAVGTATMGCNSSQNVVSPNLSVYGIAGLRVVDGSVMPQITSGNTHAPIVMIAEKAADMIKKYWKLQKPWETNQKFYFP